MRVTSVTWRLGEAIRALLMFAGIALAAITVAVAAAGPHSSYAGAHPAAAVALAAAIVALAFAAATARSRHAAMLAGLAALAATLPIWAGSARLPGGPRALADGLTPVAWPLVLALALADARDRRARAVAAATLSIGAIAAAGRTLARDPFLDVACLADCSPSPLAIVHAEAAVRTLDLWALLAVSALAAVTALVQRGQPRHAAGPALIAAGLAVRFGVLAAAPIERAADGTLALAYALTASGAAVAGAAVVADALAAASARRDARRLVHELQMDATLAQIQGGLARATRDPTLELLPAGAPTGGRAVMAVVAGGQVVARIAHEPHSRAALERALGPALRLAIANAVLRARLEGRIEELRVARERIVRHGDAARQRLERDLHDGAQQGLLAALYDLQLAAAAAAGTSHAQPLEAAADEVAEVLDDLRELAHGIHPTVLAEAGLRPALDTLALTAPIPVEITEIPDARYAPAIELAAYRLADEAVRNAAEHARPRGVVISIREQDGALVVRAADDGAGGAAIGDAGGLAEVADRVGTRGGTVTLDSRPGRGTTLEATIPCA